MDRTRSPQQLEQLVNLYLEQNNSSSILNMLEKSLISKMQNENAARTIISYINKLLNVSLNRNKGFRLLDKIIAYCPVSLLTDNAIKWTNFCINYSSKDGINMSRFAVLVKLIQTCSGTAEYNKSLMQSLSKIIDMCLSINPNEFLSKGSLECLKVCLETYPSTCGPFRIKIEKYLTKYMTCSLPPVIVRKAGSAFHYLQQVGGSGPDGITHKNNWSGQLTKLCATIHKLYKQFFKEVTEFENYDLDVEPFDFQNLFTDNSAPHLIANALKNTLVFMNCMLVECFPVEKGIAILHVLDVIKRGLLVDTYSDFDNSIEETQFAALLYLHQIDLLYLLRSLIACFKQNMIPFSFTITKLLTDCLQRTEKSYFKSSSEYKKSVYKVLNYWILIAESKLNISMHNKLVTLIISDITPAKTNVKLCLNESLSKKKGKAMKKTVHEPVNTDQSVVETQNCLEIQEITCVEALKTGKTLLEHVMLQLDQEIHKRLFQTITQQLLNIQGGKKTPLYSNPNCQAYLYEMLASILLQPIFCMSPFIQIAINIFTRGQNRSVNSNNDQIFSACTKGLHTVEKLCQATCPTLHINDLKNNELKTDTTWRKRPYEIEDSEVESNHNDFNEDDMVINENENVHQDIQITKLPQQTDYSKSPKRIRVLANQIIKAGSNSTIMVQNENKEDDEDVVLVGTMEAEPNQVAEIEEGSPPEIKDVAVVENEISSEVIDKEQEQEERYGLSPFKTELKDEAPSLNASSDFNNGFEKSDDIDIEDEEDMLNSFIDIRNEDD